MSSHPAPFVIKGFSGCHPGLEQAVESRGGVERAVDHGPAGAGQGGQVRGLLVVVTGGQDDQLVQGPGGREGVVLVGAAAVGQQDDHPAPGPGGRQLLPAALSAAPSLVTP